jgi:predicted secreted Zn-dependent protease
VPGVRIAIDTTFYDATGTTPREWLASARRNAATAGVRVPYLANTGWTTRWTYPSSRVTSIGCETQFPMVTLDIKFVMPRLVADSVVSTEDRVEWLRFLHSLWTHEAGHALRGVRAATEMRDSLQRIHTESCTTLSPTVGEAVRKVLAKYSILQASYDERTQHGARQGAMIIPVRGARLAVDTTFRDTLP